MKSALRLNIVFLSKRIPEFILLVFASLFLVTFLIICGRRYFNFDEFQVLYTSVALLREKAFYADRIDSHFPLSNIIMAFPFILTGFNEFALIASRYLIFCANAVTCFYVYRIASGLWKRYTGVLAVAIMLSSVAYVEKGIEIRHDVFNMLFNVMAAYYGLRYLGEKKRLHIVACGLLLGLAIASTQKSIIWSFGIVLGLVVSKIRKGEAKGIGRMLLAVAVLVPVPLSITILGLITVGNESLSHFVHYAVLDSVSFLNPYAKELFPFPHNRYELLKILMTQNPLLYFAGIAGSIYFAIKMVRLQYMPPAGIIVLVLWCMLGLLFYLTLRRPFFQSLLPSIPPLAIIAGGSLTEARDAVKSSSPIIKLAILLLCLFGFFIWPLQLIIPKTGQDERFWHQINNAEFCLANLTNTEKVLCFTQNQVFFDPLLPMGNSECGERFYEFSPDCFEEKMIDEQCRVIINDYRTGLLNPGIQGKIKANYLPLKNSDILIPGFVLEAREVVRKEVWIEGSYYSPSLALEVDGHKIEERLFLLTRGHHTFANLTDRSVVLVHIFKPEYFAEQADISGNINNP